MKSTSIAAPSAASNSVSSTSVPGRYRRVARGAGSAGASSQRPCSGALSSAAKQAGLSKRGQHSQSIEPSRATSAAVSQSPIKA